MTANDRQQGGTHYAATVQHWDVIVSLDFGPEYFIGCSTKYITRYRKKNGLQDLEKAMHYLDKLIEVVELNGVALPMFKRISPGRTSKTFNDFIESNGVDKNAADVIRTLLDATTVRNLRTAKNNLQNMINGYEE